jgi:hypothetical protein
MWHKYNWCWLLALFLGVCGCSKAFWLTDPYIERYFITNPPQKISISTEPQGARIVITSLRKIHIYTGYAPVEILFRPHPHIPSWILVAKPGYKSTAIRIDDKARETNLQVVLAKRQEQDDAPDDIMQGPMMGRPYMPMGNMSKMEQGRRMSPPF